MVGSLNSYIEGNEINGCVYGIECKDSGNIQILRNYIADSKYDGIISYSSSPFIYGNIITRSNNFGIFLNNISYPTIKNNLIAISAIHGIYTGKAVALRLENNIICYSDAGGIYCDNGSRTYIFNNIIYRNQTGILLRDAASLYVECNDISDNKEIDLYNKDRDDNTLIVDGERIDFHKFPCIYGNTPNFNNENYTNPNLGDFSLWDDSFLLTAGTTREVIIDGTKEVVVRNPIGLLYPEDLGTNSVNLGGEVPKN